MDKITLGPIETYERYNIFPWRFLLHVICVCFTSAQILLIIQNTGEYTQSEIRAIYKTFLDPNLELNDVDYEDTILHFDLNELAEHVNN